MIWFQLAAFALVTVAVAVLIREKRVIATVSACAVGVAVGVVLDNIALAIGLAVAAIAALPWATAILDRRRKRRLDDRMAPVMSLLTSGYLQSQDIVATVRDNLDRIPPPFRSYFERFLNDLETVDSSIAAGLHRLAAQYDHYRWRQWCTTLAACQHDRGLMHTLPPIVEELNDVRRIDVEIQTEMAREWRSYVLIALITLGEIPLCYAVNPDWGAVLTDTFGGKIVVLATFAAVAISAVLASRINRSPFEKG